MVAIVLLVVVAVPVDGALSVTGDEGTCVTRAALAEEIVARLGKNEVSSSQFEVTVSRGPPLRAELKSSAAAARTFRSADCREVLESLALAISVAIDPAVFLKPPPVKEPPPPLPPPPPVQPEPPKPIRFSAGLLGGVSAGLSSRATPSFGIVAGLRSTWFSVRADTRLDVPTVFESSVNRVTSFAWLVSLFTGWQNRFIRGGVIGSVGELRNGLDQRDQSAERNQLLGLAGLELAARLAPIDWLGLELFARVQAAFVRVSLAAGNETLWRSWPVHLLAGVAVTFGNDEAARE